MFMCIYINYIYMEVYICIYTCTTYKTECFSRPGYQIPYFELKTQIGGTLKLTYIG